MAGEQRLSPDAKMAFIALLVLAGTASAINVGIIGWLVAPICFALAIFAIVRAPLRNTMLVLMFFALVLENPAEGPACTLWSTPFQPIGGLMLQHFKSTIGFGPIGGMDVMLVTAMLVAYSRRRRATGPIGTPRPMIRLAQLTFATIVFMVLVGKWRGGQTSFALWQIDRVIYLPIVFLLCQAAFTQAKDYLAVGKVALSAAVIRASMAIWVRLTVPHTVDPLTGESSLPYATTHNDSMLFATGSVILVALLLQRAGKKYTRLAMIFGPILIGGMLANNRRIVWVEIILVLTTLYLMTDTNAFKRKLNRAMLLLAPVVAGYVAVGWGSQGGIFKPVQVIRSAVDSSADASTAWRDLENFNLVFTLRQFPLTGVGYGNPFWEMWPMPVVPYDLEKYVPHNSILGLYCYGGFVGYAGLTALWVGGIYFTIRAYHHCKAPLEKSAALAAFAAILVYYFQCFGDMGLGSWTGVYLAAPAIAIGCKLTVASGAWSMTAQTKRAARGFPASQVSRRGRPMSWHTLVAGCALLVGAAACTRSKAPPQEAPATRLPEKLSMNEHWDWNGVIGTGQSLAVGVEGLPLRATQPSYRNLKLALGRAAYPETKDTSNQLSLAPLCEPIRPFASGYPAPFPRNIYGETPHTCMASQITAMVLSATGGQGDYVSVHSVVGESGQPLRALAKGAVQVDDTGRAYAASLFEVRALTRLARQAKRSFGVAAIVLTHGEADAENPDYERGLLQLWRDYEGDVAALTGQRRGPLLLLTQQSAVPTLAGTVASSALSALAASRAEPASIVCVGPRYHYEYAPDAVHLQSIGYDRLGEKYGQVFFERSVLGHDWQPLAATSVERRPGVVSVDFHVPVPPLVWDETLPAPHPAGHPWANGRGFELLADGVPARIEAAEIDGARVNLRTSAGGRLVVRCAATASAKPRAHGTWRWGQLRDSDPFVGQTTRTAQPNHAVTFELQVP